MRYQHSLKIHQRFEAVLQLIETGRYSTPALAKEVGVSIPTVSRIVAALRERGHDIRAEKHGGWRYVVASNRGLRKDSQTTRRLTAARPTSHDD